MADTVIERLIVGIGFKVDRGSMSGVKAVYENTIAGFQAVSAVAVTAGAAVLGFGVTTAAARDEITKTAHSLGVTTEEYTRLRHALNLGGVSSEAMGTGLRGLQMQLEAAARGTGEAVYWLKEMGVSAKDAATGGVRLAADVLPELADGLLRIPEAQRGAAAMRVFGESGQRMAVALAGGSVALKAAKADADALGLTLSEQSGKDAEALTDAWTRLTAAGTGLAGIVADEVIPALTPLVDGLTEWLTASDGIARVGLERTARAIGWALEQMQTPTGKAVGGLALLGGGLQAIRTVSGVLQPALGALGMSFGGLTSAALPWIAVAGIAVLVADDLWVTMEGGDSVTRRLADSMGYGEEVVQGLTDAWGMLGEAGESFVLIGGEMVAVSRDLGDSLSTLAGPLSYLYDGLLLLSGQPLRDYFDWDPWDTGLGRFLSSVGFSSALSGFEKLNAYMRGSDQVAMGPSGANQLPLSLIPGGIGIRSAATSARERSLESMRVQTARLGTSDASGPSITIAPSTTIQAGPNRAEIERTAMEAYRRDLTSALDAAEVY